MSELTPYLAALAGFIALHNGLSATGLRAAVVKAIGEGPYRGLFSLASLALIVLVGMTYGDARASTSNITLYTPPDWARHITHLLMLIAFTLGVAGLFTPGPTFAGFESSVSNPEPARGVLRITRHPFLASVALWGVAHLIVNGDLVSVLLFGGLALMTISGMASIDRKAAARNPAAWAGFVGVTSRLPFAAILQGRNRFSAGEIGWRWIVGPLAFAGVAFAHPILFGVPAFPGLQ